MRLSRRRLQGNTTGLMSAPTVSNILTRAAPPEPKTEPKLPVERSSYAKAKADIQPFGSFLKSAPEAVETALAPPKQPKQNVEEAGDASQAPKASAETADPTPLSGFSSTVSDIATRTFIAPVLSEILPEYDRKHIHEPPAVLYYIYRDMYYYDNITGAAIDMLADLGFSDFNLTGLDVKQQKPFLESIDRMRIRRLLPQLSTEFLVHGMYAAHIPWDDDKKGYKAIIPHNPMYTRVFPNLIFGKDPTIRVDVATSLAEFNQNFSPEAKAEYEQIAGIHATTRNFTIPSDELIYMVRRGTARDVRGVSYCKRVLPIWLLEKALIRGTLDQATKRQRALAHMMIGDEEWTPTADDMRMLAEMFTAADLDPVGAVFISRRGVDINEIRRGDDFWKYPDIYDFSSRAKMQALGISEAVLSGDATLNCVTGDTLITTEHGLLRIDEMVDVDKLERGKPIDCSIKVMSRYGTEKVAKWVYNGIQDTLEIKTKQGFAIKGTKKHPTLVFNPDTGRTEWRNIQHLRKGDLICASTQELIRKSKLHLDLQRLDVSIETYDPRVIHRVKRVEPPEYMSPELAYIIGMFIAEGCYTPGDNGKLHGMRIVGTNKDAADRLVDFFEQVFGETPGLHAYHHTDTERKINGKWCKVNQPVDYRVIPRGHELCDYFVQLGCVHQKSAKKEIPWSILQADAASQLAFISGFLDGDGRVGDDRITFCSSSKKLLQQMQILLSAHGIIATLHSTEGRHLVVGTASARVLWDKLQDGIVPIKTFTCEVGDKAANRWGYPADYWFDLIEDAKIHSNKFGTLFEDVQGNEFRVNLFSRTSTNPPLLSGVIGNRRLLVDQHDDGKYTGLLQLLHRLDPEEADNLQVLMQCGYNLVEVESVKPSGKERVYDLSMTPGVEPAFVANGMVIHNTMEMALSIFVEQVRAHRETITYETFYERMFPRIAVENNITKSKARNSRKRSEESAAEDNIKGSTYHDILGSAHEYAAFSYEKFNPDKHTFPRISWHKRLRPEADTSYMEVLSTLKEQGLPIPLAMWAAAGGMDIESLINSLDEDIKQHEQLKDWKEKTKPSEGEGGMEMGSIQRRGVLGRNYEFERDAYGVRNVTGDGKRHLLTPQGAGVLEERIFKRVAEAAAEIARQENARDRQEQEAVDRARKSFVVKKPESK